MNGSILKLDSQGTQTVVIAPLSSFGSISSIAFDSNGALYFSAIAGDTSSGIYRLGTDGTPSLITTTGPNVGPTIASFTGLAFDASGNLFAEQYTDTSGLRNGIVYKVDITSGNLTTLSAGGNLVNPVSMAFDASGNLYVLTTAFGSSGIVKLDAAGNQVQFYYDTNFLPFGLAFTRGASNSYTFSGFLGSVSNPPTVNTGKTGRTYPVK